MDPYSEIYETKRTLKINLIVGAIIGAVLAGLIAFAVLSPTVNGGYFNYALAKGATEFEAGASIAVFLAVFCPLFFFYGFFLPLGYRFFKNLRTRILEGWFVSCLLLLIIEAFFIAAVLSLGSIAGFGYFIYLLIKLARAKHMLKNDRSANAA